MHLMWEILVVFIGLVFVGLSFWCMVEMLLIVNAPDPAKELDDASMPPTHAVAQSSGIMADEVECKVAVPGIDGMNGVYLYNGMDQRYTVPNGVYELHVRLASLLARWELMHRAALQRV